MEDAGVPIPRHEARVNVRADLGARVLELCWPLERCGNLHPLVRNGFAPMGIGVLRQLGRRGRFVINIFHDGFACVAANHLFFGRMRSRPEILIPSLRPQNKEEQSKRKVRFTE